MGPVVLFTTGPLLGHPNKSLEQKNTLITLKASHIHEIITYQEQIDKIS